MKVPTAVFELSRWYDTITPVKEFDIQNIQEQVERVARYQTGILALTEFLWVYKNDLQCRLADHSQSFIIAHYWTAEIPYAKKEPFAHGSIRIHRVGQEFGISIVRKDSEDQAYSLNAVRLDHEFSPAYHQLKRMKKPMTMERRVEAILSSDAIPFAWVRESGTTLVDSLELARCPSFTPVELLFSLRKQIPIT